MIDATQRQPDGETSPTTASPSRSNTSPAEPRTTGVSIAPLGDRSPLMTQAVRSFDRIAFQPRTGTLVLGIVFIVLSVWIVALLGSSVMAIVAVATISGVMVGSGLVLHSLLRWENAETAYEKERSAAESWHSNYLKLQSDADRTNAVLSHMTDGMVLLSPRNEIVLINEAARRLLALPSDGVYLGRKFAELVRIPEIVQATARARSDQIDQNVSVEIVDGSVVRPVGVRVGRIQDTHPPHLLLVLRDETDAHRVEAIRREFIANVSHELKTPLAAIKGYAETVELAIEDDPESARHFIAQIDNQCQRLESLIADMMRLARAQSGKGTLLVQTLDLNQVISQAMSSFLPVAAAKGIELAVVPSGGPVQVLADEEAALTITQNLVSNALRHTDAGGHVTVSCRRENDGWILSVTDDGVGIAPEFQERIFERFYRVHRSRKTNDGGTGIGLSIVKNLTRALGGTVQVISSPGEGATFEVWLRSPKPQ